MIYKTAIIDLYNNEHNEEIRCIREIVQEAKLEYERFDIRYKNEVPELDFDIYLSSGGPGSPFEGSGSKWEKDYFNLLDKIINHNQKSSRKKYLFFICHSFQLMARYFNFADITEREAKSFGIIPFLKTERGAKDLLLKTLPQPFFAVDMRSFQVVNPDKKKMKELGASILSVELPLDNHPRAVMAVRIGDEIVGTQFHPESDILSMMVLLVQSENKEFIINKFGKDMYYEMLRLLDQPYGIKATRKYVLPRFLKSSIRKLNLHDNHNELISRNSL